MYSILSSDQWKTMMTRKRTGDESILINTHYLSSNKAFTKDLQLEVKKKKYLHYNFEIFFLKFPLSASAPYSI